MWRRSVPSCVAHDCPGSDIDIMIQLNPASRVMVFDHVGIKEDIEGLFQGPVDGGESRGFQPLARAMGHRLCKRCILTPRASRSTISAISST